MLSSVCCLLENGRGVIDDSGWLEITGVATIALESEALVKAEISPEDARVHVTMRVNSTADCNLSFGVTLKEQIRFIE